jgi:hypothetical protein
VNVPQGVFDLICNPKIRQRELQLPLRHGAVGELKPSPMRPDRAYVLKRGIAYAEIKQRAEGLPHRARAVLWLYDRCDQPQRSVMITVHTVERDEHRDVWVVRFVLGDLVDGRRFLAATPGPPGGDYTGDPSRALKGAGEAVPASVQEKYAMETAERDANAREEKRQRALDAIRGIAPYASGRERKRLRAAENQIRALASESHKQTA